MIPAKCVKIAAQLSDEDTEAVNAALDLYQDLVVKKDDAARSAVADVLAQVESEKQEYIELINESYPELVAVPSVLKPVKAEKVDAGQVSEKDKNKARYELSSESGKDRTEGVESAGDVSKPSSVSNQIDLFTAEGKTSNKKKLNQLVRQSEVRTGTMYAGVDTVNSGSEAAHVMAPLRKYGSEQFMVLILDKDKRPMSVARMSIGTADAASVYPRDVAGAIHATPGAKYYYMAHNHPSGTITPSNADIKITKRIADLTEGSGIEFQGHVIVAPQSDKAAFFNESGSEAYDDTLAVGIKPMARSKEIPVTEGRFTKTTKDKVSITSPPQTRSYIKANHANDEGILWLDNRNNAIGFTSLSAEKMLTLRTGKVGTGMNMILSDARKRNALASILVLQKESSDSVKNMAAFLTKADIRLLDAMSFSDDGIVSAAERGTISSGASGAFFSRNGGAKYSLLTKPQVKTITTALQGSVGATIQVVDTETSLPPEIITQAEKEGATGEIRAVHWKGDIYIVADQMRDRVDVEQSLLHESQHFAGDNYFGKDKGMAYQALWMKIGGVSGMKKLAKQSGFSMDSYFKTADDLLKKGATGSKERAVYLVDEFLAHTKQQQAYESLPARIKRAIKEFLGQIRDLLRKSGFVEIQKANDADISYLLKTMNSAVRGKPKGGVFNKVPAFMVFYHGSIRKFDKPSLNFYGEGEGGQGFGYGFHVTTTEGSALNYADGTGFVYELEIPRKLESTFLDYHLPLRKQSKEVIDILRQASLMSDPLMTGEELYYDIADSMGGDYGGDKLASEFLDSVGIKGIRYKDDLAAHYESVFGQDDKIREGKLYNYTVFDPSIIKITAINGKPVTKPESEKAIAEMREPSDLNILFSRTPERNYTKEQQAAIDKGGFGAQKEIYNNPLKAALGKAKDRIDESKQVWKTILRQGFLDQYDSFRTIINDKRAWMMANLSEASGGAVEAALEYGQPFMNQGAVDVDVDKKSLSQIFEPLGAEVNDWLMWVAGNRAERLASEDRERLFADVDIQALKSLNRGKMDDGRSRSQVYESVRKDFEEMNDAFVKIGTKTGVISPDEAAIWRKQGFYVPFYRIAEEEAKRGVTGPYTGGGLVKQTAYKRLKGADIPLGDLLTNVIMNWNHIVSSGLKNQAAVEALSTAEDIGLATQVSEKDKSNDAVFIRIRGKKMWLELNQSKEGQLVLESLMSLNHEGMNNFMMKAARKFKRALTYGVTANPEFKVANLVRDSIQAIAVAGMSKNVFKNLKQGFGATKKGSPTIARMIAGGGAFGDSGYIHGSDPEALQRLIKKDIDRMTILDSPKRIQKMWDAYQDFGARLESVNRAANFEQDLSRGDADLLTANFNARDHLDFQRTGAFTSIRILAQVVPFLNARLQGLSKLGRAGFDEKQRKQFLSVVGTYAAASVLLYLYMKDDDDYDEAPQWERDTYHLFKIPGSDVMYRFPRPFEVGFIATVAERAVEQMVNDKVHGGLFFERVWHGISETLSFNPTPQMIMPAVEVWANHNMFTNRQIESESMKNLSPSNRKRAWTSETAIAMSKGFDAILWDEVVLSPLQIEHLVNGYLGWMGGFVLASTDEAIRMTGLVPDTPEWRIQDYMLVGRFARTGPTRGTKYLTEFYENLHDANRAFADINFARQLEDKERAMKLAEKNKDKLAIRGAYTQAQKAISMLNKRIMVIRIKYIPSDEKLEEIDRLNIMKNQIAKRVIERTEELK